MAKYDDEPRAMAPEHEPMHQRVLVLEKQFREMREEIEEISALLRRVTAIVNRELTTDG